MGLMDKIQGVPSNQTELHKIKQAEPTELVTVRSEQGISVQPTDEAMFKLIMSGDLSKLSQQQRLTYYRKVCDDVGLNPLTKPFDYVEFKGKTMLVANKECSAQLAARHKVSVEVTSMTMLADISVIECWVRAKSPDGRITDELGCVPCSAKVTGSDAANARMKAVTKAKRRATLAHCGLGVLDESELDTMGGAQLVRAETAHIEPEVVKTGTTATAKQEQVVPVSHQDSVVIIEATVGSDCGAHGPFLWESKEHRQTLIKQIKLRFPGIGKDNIVKIADVYRSAADWAPILRNLDDLLAMEKAMGGDSKLLNAVST